jgi:two-component sensor histidine kinase
MTADFGLGAAFLEEGGKMGALMRAHDWSRSPLGYPETWPDTLKTAVATCLSSRFPMVVWWGQDLIMLYNDAWQPILGETKHPHGMGRPGEESWQETWPIVGKQFEEALKGHASWSEDLLLASDRHGYMEECYFTYSHSPLRNARGGVVGVLSTVSETTSRVLSERRLRVLGELSAATIEATAQKKTSEEVGGILIDILCSNNPDVSFAALLLNDGSQTAKLAAISGINPSLLPSSVTQRHRDPWGIGRALGGVSPVVSSDLTSVVGLLSGGVWPEPTVQVVALPLLRSKHPFGALLVGVNSRLRADKAYLDFIALVATQVSGAILAMDSVAEEQRAVTVRELLVRELQHRTRNLLALVEAISAKTQATSCSLDDYGKMFKGRLDALSRVQGLLSIDKEQSISLDQLIRMELSLLPSEEAARIDARGDAVSLPRRSVQLLALAIHELLTNAVKHGGLSASGAGVQISWRVADNAVLLEWAEKLKHPLVAVEKENRGFGRALLERALPYELDATSHFKLLPTGLKYTVQFPLLQGKRVQRA